MYGAGKPDLTIIYNGKAILVELKVGNNTLTKLQEAFFDNALKKGVCCAVFKLKKVSKRINRKELVNHILDALDILYKSTPQHLIRFLWEV